jgi:hypothetical protein
MAGSASAAQLNWEGTLEVLMVEFGRGGVTGGGVATVNGSAGIVPAHLSTLRLAASRGQVNGTSTEFITDPELAGNGVAAVVYEALQGGTGTFGVISGGAASTGAMTSPAMPVSGLLKLCLLNTECTLTLAVPFTKPTTVNGVPGTGFEVAAGVGGLLTIGGYGGIRLSMQYAPWTIKTVTATDHITTPDGGQIFSDIVYKGWAHAPASTTSSTAQPGGMVQLVTPSQVTSNLPLGSNAKIGAATIFVVRFIPEPGLLMLLGSGVVGLALLGRGRMRS